MTNTLRDRFLRFAANLPDAELIDDIPLTEPQKQAKKADVFFEKRSIVAEVKSLLTDVSQKADKILDPIRDRPGFPGFYGKWPIDVILNRLSDGEQIKRKLYEVVSAGVADAVADANRQIRTTKHTFGIVDGHGLLIILNDTVEILDPNMVAHRVVNTLRKRSDDGSPRYPEIGAVWIIGETHRVQVNPALQGIPAIIFAHPLAPDDAAIQFLDRIQQPWADFMNMPLVRMEQGSFAQVEITPSRDYEEHRKERTVSDVWRTAYAGHPYLRDLSDEELTFYGARLTVEMAALQQHPMTTKNTCLRSTRRWSDVNSELNHRHLDIQLVRRLADREGMRFQDSGESWERTKLLADACDVVVQ